eukprot:7055905-Lingulodinium_polyedra.AAC.1
MGGGGVGCGPADVASPQGAASAAGGLRAECPDRTGEVDALAGAAAAFDLLLALAGVGAAPGGLRDLLGVAGGAHGRFQFPCPS